MNDLNLGYDPLLALCGIVLLPVIRWWWKQPLEGTTKYFGYYAILCFSRGSLDLLNLMNPTILRYVIELPLIIFYLKTIAHSTKKDYPARILVPIFIIICCISGIQTSAIMVVFFLLYFMEIYMFLFCVINNFDHTEASYLNKLFVLLALSQIFASFIKLVLVGVMEPYIGTMASHEGGITTVFSLVCFCVAFEFYLQTKKKRCLWLMIGFLAFGIIGEKRALAFLIPLFCFITIWIHAYLSNTIFKSLQKLLLAFIFAPVVFIAVCILSPSLNPEKKIGGSFDIEYVLNFTEEYNEGKKNEVGRGKAASVIHEKLLNGSTYNLFFGYGTGTLIPSSFNSDSYSSSELNKRFGVSYSLGVGYLNILVQVGVLGVLIYLGMFVYLLVTLVKLVRQHYFALNQEQQAWCISTCIALVCVLLLSLVYNKASLYFNGASMLVMWMVAYSLQILEDNNQEDIVLIELADDEEYSD